MGHAADVSPGGLPAPIPVTMRDLKSEAWIRFKGLLFVFLGTGAVAALLVEFPFPRVALLLAIAIWSFCRAYYFAFYVIGKYLDPSFRFSGLGSALAWLVRRDGNRR